MNGNRRFRVLVVEDEPDVALVTSTRLQVNGFEVAVAADGTTAVTMAQELRPDVVLVDLKLPDISGQEVIRRIRTDVHFESVPVLVFTASSSDHNDLERIRRDIGADGYIRKPYAPYELIDKINSLLLQQQQAEVGD